LKKTYFCRFSQIEKHKPLIFNEFFVLNSHSDFLRVDIRVGTVCSFELDANKPSPLLRVDCGPEGEKIAMTGWVATPENILGKQVLLVTNICAEEIPHGSRADSLIFSPKEGVWCTPIKQCKNGYKLA